MTVLCMGIVGVLAAGCATSLGSKAKENETLKTQVASLESQITGLNQRIEEISQQQTVLEAQLQNGSSSRPQTARVKAATTLSPRDIQVALKTAGFYEGPLDGKLGPKTKEAVKSFQKAQGLTPDGQVGSRTSVALAKYLGGNRE